MMVILAPALHANEEKPELKDMETGRTVTIKDVDEWIGAGAPNIAHG